SGLRRRLICTRMWQLILVILMAAWVLRDHATLAQSFSTGSTGADGDFHPVGIGVMLDRHGYMTATELSNGNVLIAGGYNTGYQNTAELFEPAVGTFKRTGALNVSRYVHAATRLANGKVLITGGDRSGATASAELYDPATQTFTNTGAMTM